MYELKPLSYEMDIVQAEFGHIVDIDRIVIFRAFVFEFSHWPIFKPENIRSLWFIVVRISNGKWKIGL